MELSNRIELVEIMKVDILTTSEKTIIPFGTLEETRVFFSLINMNVLMFFWRR